MGVFLFFCSGVYFCGFRQGRFEPIGVVWNWAGVDDVKLIYVPKLIEQSNDVPPTGLG